MSYILDALKKSDRERQQETLSPLQHLYETPPSSRDTGILRRRNWPWFLLCGLLILGGLVKMIGWNQWSNPNPPGPAGEIPPQPAPASMEVAVEAAQQEPAGQTSPSSTSADAENRRSVSSLTVQAEWFDDWFQHVPKKDYSLPSAGSSPPGEVEGKELPPAISKTATGSKKIPKPVKIARDHAKIVKVLPQPDPAAVVGQPQSVLTVIGQPQPVPAEKPKSNLPYLQDLSPQVQAEIPKLEFAGHAYALDPSQRLIVINGAIMREGDQIDAATRLTEITWEGVIIDRNGVQFQVKCY